MARLDSRILQCLLVDGRAPFRRVAEVVGVSEQTVARRYRAMRTAGVVRVSAGRSGFSDAQRSWTVRVRCRPAASAALAEALAARPEVGWVSLVSGGSEIDCAITAPADADDVGILGRLPHTREVLSFDAKELLRAFAGASDGWRGLPDPLDARQLAVLRGSRRRQPASEAEGGVALEVPDEALLRALARDGRASVAALAREVGRPAAATSARLEALLGSGVLHLSTDYLPEEFGLRAAAVLQLRVPPGRVVEAGEALSSHRQTGFVAATTGSTNLVAVVACRSVRALFDYLTEEVGSLPDVQHLDVAPVLRRVKEGRSRVADGRLVGPS